MVDQGGHPIAHSTSAHFSFPPGAATGCALAAAASPWYAVTCRLVRRRETPTQIVPVGPEQLQQLSGLEILAAQLEGEAPAAPISTGMRASG